MELNVNLNKNLVVCAISLLFVSLILVSSAHAATDLNLPSSTVIIQANNGTSSYFVINLTQVPPGNFDVHNDTYPGWCVDRQYNMQRLVPHDVQLFSSINPPEGLNNQRWDAVNYILNHKQNGTAEDIQEAIWYFVNFLPANRTYVPTSNTAWLIINSTKQNGTGFVPISGQSVAVICRPEMIFPGQTNVQYTIIEVAMPNFPEFSSAPAMALIFVAISSAIIYLKKDSFRQKCHI